MKDIFKYSVNFCKKGDMVYISHLDLMRLFRRAIRRAEAPFVLTNGFTPRVKISMPEALKLGKESENETAHFFMRGKIDEFSFIENMNKQLPEGIKILKIRL